MNLTRKNFVRMFTIERMATDGFYVSETEKAFFNAHLKYMVEDLKEMKSDIARMWEIMPTFEL